MSIQGKLELGTTLLTLAAQSVVRDMSRIADDSLLLLLLATVSILGMWKGYKVILLSHALRRCALSQCDSPWTQR